MFLGGSAAREGQQAVLDSAVVSSLGAHAAFDGIVGQDVLGQYPVSRECVCVFKHSAVVQSLGARAAFDGIVGQDPVSFEVVAYVKVCVCNASGRRRRASHISTMHDHCTTNQLINQPADSHRIRSLPHHRTTHEQLADWDFRHSMLRLYASNSSSSDSSSGGVPFDGLLDYWPLPSSAATLVPARLVTGVGSELVGPNAFMAVEVVVNGREVGALMIGACMHGGWWWGKQLIARFFALHESHPLHPHPSFLPYATHQLPPVIANHPTLPSSHTLKTKTGHPRPRPPRHGRAGQRAQHRGGRRLGADRCGTHAPYPPCLTTMSSSLCFPSPPIL